MDPWTIFGWCCVVIGVCMATVTVVMTLTFVLGVILGTREEEPETSFDIDLGGTP